MNIQEGNGKRTTPIDKVLGNLDGVKKAGVNQWMARCPAHDDKTPSLAVSKGRGNRVLLNCHTGCAVEQICDAIGLTVADLHTPTKAAKRQSKTKAKCRMEYASLKRATENAERVWPYQNAEGDEVFWVARYEGKKYYPYCRVGDCIVCKDPEGPIPLYNMPQIKEADSIYFCEGEKAADAAIEIGLVATCSAHGAKSAKYDKHQWGALAGKSVTILPDNDQAGRKYAIDVANILATQLDPPAIVKIVALPGLPEKGDIVEFIEAQHDNGDDDLQIRCKIEKLSSDADVFKPAEPAPADESENDAQPKVNQSDLLVGLAVQANVELWHDLDNQAYGTIPVADHFESYLLQSKTFSMWLARSYYDKHDKAPNSQAITEALLVLKGHAVFTGPEYEVNIRYASVDDEVYLDLGDDSWSAIKVTRKGWSIVASCPVKFTRSRGMQALPEPTREGNLGDLRQLINYGTEQQFCIMVSWVLGCFMPKGPYPCLELDGEQGSAKSTTCRMLRRLIDPNKADIRSSPRDERDLVIAARNGHVIALDNLSGCSIRLSDSLCRLATGAGFGTREMRADTDEILFSVARPITFNGIGGVANRSDLMDRTLRVSLPRITERRDERELWKAFDEAQSGLLGSLLDAVVTALKRLDAVEIENMPRMADFARWIVAAEPALPWEEGYFLQSYSSNQEVAHQDAVEAAIIGPPLIALLAKKPYRFEGTATELREKLIVEFEGTVQINGFRKQSCRLTKDWPKQANNLGVQLKRIAPNLRAMGYTVDLEGHTGDRRCYFLKAPKRRH